MQTNIMAAMAIIVTVVMLALPMVRVLPASRPDVAAVVGKEGQLLFVDQNVTEVPSGAVRQEAPKVLEVPEMWNNTRQPRVQPNQTQYTAMGTLDCVGYNMSAWSSLTEVNQWAAAQSNDAAEIVTIVSTPMDYRICGLIETGIRMGFNMSIVLAGPAQTFRLRQKQPLSLRYVLRRRFEMLQQLGFYTDVDLDAHLAAKGTIENLPTPTDEELAALKRHMSTNRNAIVFVDAFDVLVQLPVRELYAKWRAMWPDKGFVMGTEANLYPLKDLDLFPDYKLYRFPFPNSGVWFGFVDEVIRFLEYVISHKRPECDKYPSDDQCLVLMAMVDLQQSIPRDVNGSVVLSMFKGEKFDSNVEATMCRAGLLRCKDDNHTPVFIHWNGYAKLKWYFNNPAALFRNYKAYAWHRRLHPDMSLPPFSYFHVAPATLHKHLTLFDSDARVLPDGPTQILDLCWRAPPAETDK